MTPEDRLREAISARTSQVEAGPDALDKIQEKLMSTRDRTTTRILAAVGTAAAVVAAVVIGLTITGEDDDDRVDTADTTTTSGDTTTTTLAVTPVDAETTVFPNPETSQRFDDPQALVSTFATDFLGYRDPVIGEFRQGDSRSGEVEVRAFASGEPMTVVVRQLEDDTWFVLGASVESIRLDTPQAGATLTSPQELAGAALAFEGTVVVRLYTDGEVDPIGDTFVTGGGDEMRDFTGELTFDAPAGAEHGVLVLLQASAEDGSTVAATVIRVHL